MDELLRISENKAMKLFVSTFFIIVLLGFAGGSYGQTDFEVTKLLAEQGEAFAQYNLGVMYENGVGVPENVADAVKWYRLAAEQGRARAQNNLGVMYENGEGVSENNAEAIKWFRLPSSEEMPPVRELLKRR